MSGQSPSHALSTVVLLGARLSRRGGDTSEMLIGLGIAAVGIAAVCAALYFGHRALKRWRGQSHFLLFVGLCRAHGLKGRERGLLKLLARHHRLQHASRLFTESGWLDSTRLPAGLGRRAEEIAELRERLFGFGSASDAPEAA